MTGLLSRAGAAWLLAALTAVTVIAAALSLEAVFDAPPGAWLLPASVPAVMGLAGAAVARSLGGRMVRPLVGGLAVGALAWCLQWWPETLLAGLVPHAATAAAIAGSAGELREVIWTDTIPVTPTDPVLAGVGAALGLTALVTDAIAVGLRSPAIAGIPPLALVGGAAVITAGVAPWPALAVAAAGWLGLLAVGNDAVLSLVHREPSGRARQHAGERPAGSAGSASSAGVAGWPVGTLVAGTAAVAVLVVSATQLPFLATGLAPEGQRFVLGQGAGPVNPAADLGRELRSNTGYAGISYRTEDGRGVYLRTAVVDDVYASPWDAQPPQYTGPPTITGFDPAGARLAGGTDRLQEQAESGVDGPWSVVSLSLDDWSGNWAPLPDQVWAVDQIVGDWGWQVDPSTSVAFRREATPVELDYRAAVVPLRMDFRELADLAGPGAPQGIYNRWGADPDLAGSDVEALAHEVTDGMANPVEQAAAIQAHLTSERFTYSETAPVERGYDGSGLEMTEQFLEAGAGYCIHYASAMTMMAQAVGIPARVVVGYAPVAATGAVHRVTSDRAHSWPELYLDGVGWVPFEPTPGVGRTPGYSQAEDSGAEGPEADPTLPGAAPTSGASSPSPAAAGDGAGSAGRDGGTRPGQALSALVLGLALAAVLAALAVVPRWLRARRRRRRLDASGGAGRTGASGAAANGVGANGVGAQRLRREVRDAWQELEDTAVDLGVGRRPYESEPTFARRLAAGGDSSPARAAGHGTTATMVDMDVEATVNVESIIEAISWARYAPDREPAPAAAIGSAGRVGAFIADLEQAADPAARRRARWLPASLLPATLLPPSLSPAGRR